MATRCNRFINRTSISSLKFAIKSNLRTASASIDQSATSSSLKFSLPTRSSSSPLRQFSLSNCLSKDDVMPELVVEKLQSSL